jgi:hypothetical protein
VVRECADLGIRHVWLHRSFGQGSVAEEAVGEVSNALFRFMSRYIFGHTATLDAYLSSLARRFGEDMTPQ